MPSHPGAQAFGISAPCRPVASRGESARRGGEAAPAVEMTQACQGDAPVFEQRDDEIEVDAGEALHSAGASASLFFAIFPTFARPAFFTTSVRSSRPSGCRPSTKWKPT